MIGRQLAVTSAAFDHKWHITTIVFNYVSHRRVRQSIFVSKATFRFVFQKQWYPLFCLAHPFKLTFFWKLLALLIYDQSITRKNYSFWLHWYNCIELTITFCSTFPFCALEGAAERQCSFFCSFRHWCCLMLSFIRIIDVWFHSGGSSQEAVPLLLLLALILLVLLALAAFYRHHWGHKLPVRSLSITNHLHIHCCHSYIVIFVIV